MSHRQLSDYARPQKTTRGTKLSGRWDSRATPVTIRYVAVTPYSGTLSTRWTHDGLRIYNPHHKLFETPATEEEDTI